MRGSWWPMSLGLVEIGPHPVRVPGKAPKKKLTFGWPPAQKQDQSGRVEDQHILAELGL